MLLRIIFFILAFHPTLAQKTPLVSIDEMKQIIGKWEGVLTYLDYTTKQPFSMPAVVEISQIGSSNLFRSIQSYPNEPNANSLDTIYLSDDGTMINGEKITHKQRLSDGSNKIITQAKATDGNDKKTALVRHTFIIGAHNLIIRKEVQFDETLQWIQRHEYNYKNKK